MNQRNIRSALLLIVIILFLPSIPGFPEALDLSVVREADEERTAFEESAQAAADAVEDDGFISIQELSEKRTAAYQAADPEQKDRWYAARVGVEERLWTLEPNEVSFKLKSWDRDRKEWIATIECGDNSFPISLEFRWDISQRPDGKTVFDTANAQARAGTLGARISYILRWVEGPLWDKRIISVDIVGTDPAGAEVGIDQIAWDSERSSWRFDIGYPVIATMISHEPTLLGEAGLADGDIAIGGVGPITGEAAVFGNSERQGMELAVAEWNAAGGVLGRPIKLVFADDRGDPAEGAAVYAKLIEKAKVRGIVGAVMSKVSLAGAPLAQQAKVPMVSPTSTNERVTQVGDFIFRACFIDPFQGTLGALFAFDDLKARKAACLFDVGNGYTTGLARRFKEKFEALGGSIVGFETHVANTMDFKDQLGRILRQRPDVLYVPDYYNDAALVARQARELGYEGPMVGGDGWDSPEFAKIGGKAVENCFFTNHFDPGDGRPFVREFIRRFSAKYSVKPDAIATLGYDAMQILLNAIKTAGTTDGAAVRKALARTDIIAVTGRIRFGGDRNPIKGGVIIKIENGRQVYYRAIDPDGSAAPPARPSGKILRIATQSPLSGGMSPIGTGIKNGAQLAVKRLSGPLARMGFDIELVPFDDRADPETGAANAGRIAADPRVLAVVGHFNSGVQLRASEVYHRSEILNLTPASTNPKVTERGYLEVNRACGRDDVQGTVGARFARGRNVSSVYVLHDKTAYGQGVAERFRDEAQTLGILVRGFVGTEEKRSFASLLAPILQSKPEAIYFGGMFDQTAVFFKEAREKGYAGMFLSCDGLDTSEAAAIAGESLAKGAGTFFSTVFAAANAYPGAMTFRADYLAAYGEEPQPLAAQAYDCAAVALKAIERAARAAGNSAPSRAAVAEAARSLRNFPGITGTIEFTEKGELSRAKYMVVQVASGDPALWSSSSIVQVIEVEAPH